MDILQETKDLSKKTFINHVFSSADEDKAEIFNIIQYAIMALIPVIVLNKTIQKFIPEADSEKSSLEILIEILIQVIVIFCGMVVIHRVITWFPTYSGFKYENMALTNIILGFLIIILSIQSKIGIKTNILFDRVSELWNGGDNEDKKKTIKNNLRVSSPMTMHVPSQSDFLDNPMVQDSMFPPAPSAVNISKPQQTYDVSNEYMLPTGPVAANAMLGGSFGSAF